MTKKYGKQKWKKKEIKRIKAESAKKTENKEDK